MNNASYDSGENHARTHYADGSRSLYLRESGGRQTFLLGKGYEEDLRGDGRRGERRYFIYAGGGAVARHTVPGAGSADPTTRTHYFHKDALGSVAALTDHLGKLVQRFVYKLGGEQQVLFTGADFQALARGGVPANFAPLTRRGYTGHGAGAGVQLVDMNGRYYDAQMMRFVSADPFVQSPNIAASHNRYSYAWNNPNKYTDPSGYFIDELARVWRENWRTIVVVAVAVAISFIPGGQSVGMQILIAALKGALAGFASAALSVRLQGGTWNQATKAGLRGGRNGAVSALVFYGGGQLGTLGEMSDAARLTMQSLMHGAATAALAAARGGNSRDFWAGFASGAISKGFGPEYVEGDTSWNTFGKAMQAAAVGGTTSKISGGGFENGAVTAAFAYIFNSAGKQAEERTAYETPEKAAVAGLSRAFHDPKFDSKGKILSQSGGGYKLRGGRGYTYGFMSTAGEDGLTRIPLGDDFVAWFITYPYDPSPVHNFSDDAAYNAYRETLKGSALELTRLVEQGLQRKIPVYLLATDGAIKRFDTVTGPLYYTTIREKGTFPWPRK